MHLLQKTLGHLTQVERTVYGDLRTGAKFTDICETPFVAQGLIERLLKAPFIHIFV